MFESIFSGITAIGNAISMVGAYITGVAAKVGPFVSKFAEVFMSVIAKIPKIDLETVKSVIDVACNIIHSVCVFLGINSEENPAVLGAKAEQAERTLSDFDNDTEAYIKYLKDEIELDKEKFEKMSTEEKMGCKSIGLALETKAVEEKIGGIKMSPEYVATLAKIQMGSELLISAKDLIDLITGLKNAGITNMNDVTDYLKGKGESDRIKTGIALKEAVSKLDNVRNSEKYVEEMKQAVRQYEED